MTATLRKQIERSNRKARGEKRVEVYLTPDDVGWLSEIDPAPAKALRLLLEASILSDKLKAELEK